ncbi:sigma-70 family RNA polymerase sigma factor [Streptomyces sp. NPDC006656]|uniref:RNA polymerase sigma factor n=1 Tax=Streptomyces TaxID=1883 RepID=UPI0033FFF9A6
MASSPVTSTGDTQWEAGCGEDTASASQARFQQLYRELHPRLTRYLQLQFPSLGRAAAEDVVAEVFVVVYRDWGRIEAMDNPVHYLHVATRNRAIDAFRRLQRAPLTAAGAIDDLAERTNLLNVTQMHSHGYSRTDTGDVAAEVLQEGLQAMRPTQRRKVASLQARGLTDVEIAAALAIPLAQVHVQRHRAVRELRQALKRFIRNPSIDPPGGEQPGAPQEPTPDSC